MPDLTLSADMTPHVFGIGNSDKHDVTGFHSEALVKSKTASKDSSEQIPIIHDRRHQNVKTGCFLARWSYSASDTGGKWSDMFPADMTKDQVVAAIEEAVAYWNKAVTPDSTRLASLCKKYNVSWVGQATIKGYTVLVGGKTSSKKVTTSYPLRGGNSNY